MLVDVENITAKENAMRNEDRVDALLDQALEMTFPASDPFTIYSPPVDPEETLAERGRTPS